MYYDDEEETIKIILKTKSFLESLCSPHNCETLPPTESFNQMIDDLKKFLREYCQHRITKDHIDLGFDSTKTIFYCEKCYTSFHSFSPQVRKTKLEQIVSGSPKDIISESPLFNQMMNEIEKGLHPPQRRIGVIHESNSSFDISSHKERENSGDGDPFTIDTDWQDVTPITL